MGSLIEIQSQIEKLQKQVAEIKLREFDKTVQQILTMMGAFGITLSELQQAGGDASRKPAARKSKSTKPATKKSAADKKTTRKSLVSRGAKLVAKYRGPKGGTWSGRGSMPRWRAAFVPAGKSRESFAA